MDGQFSWFFDVVTIGLALVFIYLGGKRGFLKSFLLIIGYALAIILSFFLSNSATPIIYKNIIQPQIITVIKTKLDDVDICESIQKIFNRDYVGLAVDKNELNDIILKDSNDFKGSVNKYIEEKKTKAGISDEIPTDDVNNKIDDIISSSVEKFINMLPDFMSSSVGEYLAQSNDMLAGLEQSFTLSRDDTVNFIESNIIRPNLISLMKIIVFVIAFSIAAVLIKLLSYAFQWVNNIPIAGPINILLGAALGVGQWVVTMFVIVVILQIIILLSNNEMLVFNLQTLDETSIFKMFYNFSTTIEYWQAAISSDVVRLSIYAENYYF